MMSKAPGKVMIAGEYSVLLGKPALVAAVDRFAQSSFCPDTQLQFFSNTSGKIVLEQSSRLFSSVRTTCEENGLSLPPGRYELDTRDFFSNAQKVGLGSSAAGIVALVQLIASLHKKDTKELIFALSHKAHSLFAGGIGSGADCAASTYGQTIRYCPPPALHICPVNILKEYLMVIALGIPQSTSVFVHEFIKHKDSNYIVDFAHKSELIVSDLVRDPSAKKYIRGFEELAALLKNLGHYLGIPIVSPEHQEIIKLAKLCQGASKPSGAGGGDIAIAAILPSQQEKFTKLLDEHGFQSLSLSFL